MQEIICVVQFIIQLFIINISILTGCHPRLLLKIWMGKNCSHNSKTAKVFVWIQEEIVTRMEMAGRRVYTTFWLEGIFWLSIWKIVITGEWNYEKYGWWMIIYKMGFWTFKALGKNLKQIWI